MELRFEHEDGLYPVFRWGTSPLDEAAAAEPVQVRYMSGERAAVKYRTARRLDAARWEALAEWRHGAHRLRILDVWTAEPSRVAVRRRLTVAGTGAGDAQAGGKPDGVQLRLCLAMPGRAAAPWRFCAPATHYTEAMPLERYREAKTYMDDRLSYPFVLGYDSERNVAYTFARTLLPRTSNAPQRPDKAACYLQRTEVGSLGYAVLNGGERVEWSAYWPYYEGEGSVALDSRGKPVAAFYPLDGADFEIELAYDFRIGEASGFAEAAFAAFKSYAELNPPQPVQLPFTLRDSIEYRSASLGQSYRELPGGGAGFFFHFDPRLGYDSQPSGFGTSFNHIPHETYTGILEYGFTGRQLNAAYTMARRYGGPWIGRSERVVQFFVDRLAMPNGFLYSLYDIRRGRPFAAFGEPEAPKLHYISHGTTPGNYLRTMVEPAYDLLLCSRLYASLGREHPEWRNAALRFADFLLRHQNEDGSWFRAYEPDGTPLRRGIGFGHDDASAKSASAIPIPFLLAVGKECGGAGEPYVRAARRAGDFVLERYVAADHYQGGTLDNPNVVDKEAAQYAMAALLGLHERTGDDRYLQGAVRAARLFVTWNYIWNAPSLPGTPLHNAGFRTVGMGGINSIWGGGVVDIYSLFHIKELDRLGCLTGEAFFRRMAEWIAVGTQQVLSWPGDRMGFADIGMQPEGFGVCSQGEDEGMIAKGDIWGTLGWIYSAGIFGLSRFLDARAGEPGSVE